MAVVGVVSHVTAREGCRPTRRGCTKRACGDVATHRIVPCFKIRGDCAFNHDETYNVRVGFGTKPVMSRSTFRVGFSGF